MTCTRGHGVHLEHIKKFLDFLSKANEDSLAGFSRSKKNYRLKFLSYNPALE